MSDLRVIPASDSTAGAPGSEPLVGRVLEEARGFGRAGQRLTGELLKIATGSSDLAPKKSDKRFADPTWDDNPVYRRVKQSYLAGCGFLDELVDEHARAGHRTEGARFAVNLATSVVAPTNVLAGNPAAIKRTFETGGVNLLRGARHFLGDVRHNGGFPSQVDRNALKVGRDLGLSPGWVIDRDPCGELLQFSPTTDQVRERPVIVVPPPIGRYYFLDLRPGRSFVEYAVSRGISTFMISWRNPTTTERGWTLDTYAQRLLSAIDVVREVTGSADVNVIGFCFGGIIQTTALNYLAAIRDERMHSASYAVTLLDFEQDAPIKAFASKGVLALARANSRRTGIISAREMSSMFTLMRPNDLIWNYWVNQYLLGNSPPVFDILTWNADGTNLSASVHDELLGIFEDNLLCRPGAISVLGTPVDLASIKVPIFVTGATTDHLTPWQGCYRTTQLLGGPATFVLSNAGHIQSLVNPPGNPKASYRVGPEPPADPQEWLAAAVEHRGSWWEPWGDWITEHSGELRSAPPAPGSVLHPALDAAPGRYVFDAAA